MQPFRVRWVNTQYLYNIYTMLDQRRKRWADVVLILYNFCVYWVASAGLMFGQCRRWWASIEPIFNQCVVFWVYQSVWINHCLTYCLSVLLVASELKDPICHSDECQIGSFSSEATYCPLQSHPANRSWLTPTTLICVDRSWLTPTTLICVNRSWLTPTTLKYFQINHAWKPKGVFNLKSS